MKDYYNDVKKEAKELITMGRALSNAGYFMERVVREQVIAKKAIDRYNDKLFKKAGLKQKMVDMDNEIARLTKLLKEAQQK